MFLSYAAFSSARTSRDTSTTAIQKSSSRVISSVGDGWNAAGLVFCSDVGTPINPSNLISQLDRFLRQTELPRLRFHHLRHTYAALNIATGMDLYTLSCRMGHSSITITADKYGYLYQGHNQDADALDRLLKRST